MNDSELVRRVTRTVGALNLLRAPASFIVGALPNGLARALASLAASDVGDVAFESLDQYWRMRNPGGGSLQSSNAVLRALWEASESSLGSLQVYASQYEYREVLGAAVGMQPNYPRGWSQASVSCEEILARARGGTWRLESTRPDAISMIPDEPSSGVVDSRTRDLIADIRSIPGCRAHLLWGPPGAGKSVAARQVAGEIGEGSWVRVCGSTCTEPEVWEALDILRPRALIIDDIDIGAGSESALMAGLERARGWARVIVSTANTVPSQGEDEAARGAKLRGAVIRRASDGALVEYRALSPEVRKALAPDVPAELETGDLLAKYQVELQRRATARGVTQGDVDEQRALQGVVGAS